MLPSNPLTSLTLSQATATMKVGDTRNITVSAFTPADADDKTIEWTTSAASVATVTNGVITAVGEGTADIIATNPATGVNAKVAVTVNPADTTA